MSAAEQVGVVFLVGAGPGDPGLITVRGRDLLERADVVIYDYLSNPDLLSHCPRAQQIYVGKKAAQHTLSQQEISDLLVQKAREGKRVVRLKGGDPFVFGRGGEEAESLAAAGVLFEIVPGITAAIAGPAYAGIPVTHRELNSSFTLITGHEKEEQYQDPDGSHASTGGAASDLDWASIARLPCIALYMGVKSLPRICQRLIEHGMGPNTPAATIQWATTPRQRTVVATVAELPERVADAGLSSPAITIIGQVVSMRQNLNWFESRPLFGRTIAVTRTRQQASALSQRLRELGAEVIQTPTIELAPPADWKQVDQALLSLTGAVPPLAPSRNSPASAKAQAAKPVDWLIFTSANGVAYTKQRLFDLTLDARIFAGMKVAAIGDATARAIREQLCITVDLCPESFVAEALADELIARGEVKGKSFLLLRADIARPVLRQRLDEAGAALVKDVSIYETRPAQALPTKLMDALAESRLSWMTFTSSSTAENFVSLLGDDYAQKLKDVKIASIGPITTATLRRLGLIPTVQADTFNIDGLVEAILLAEAKR